MKHVGYGEANMFLHRLLLLLITAGVVRKASMSEWMASTSMQH